jgi:hypothetical protein
MHGDVVQTDYGIVVEPTIISVDIQMIEIKFAIFVSFQC